MIDELTNLRQDLQDLKKVAYMQNTQEASLSNFTTSAPYYATFNAQHMIELDELRAKVRFYEQEHQQLVSDSRTKDKIIARYVEDLDTKEKTLKTQETQIEILEQRLKAEQEKVKELLSLNSNSKTQTIEKKFSQQNLAQDSLPLQQQTQGKLSQQQSQINSYRPMSQRYLTQQQPAQQQDQQMLVQSQVQIKRNPMENLNYSKIKRNEISQFLNESSFVQSNSFLQRENYNPVVGQPSIIHIQKERDPNQEAENIINQKQLEMEDLQVDQEDKEEEYVLHTDVYGEDYDLDFEKQKENRCMNQQEKLLMKLFPERAIKASAFVDMMNTSSIDKFQLRIRNPKKKLAQDIDFAQIIKFNMVQSKGGSCLTGRIEHSIANYEDKGFYI